MRQNRLDDLLKHYSLGEVGNNNFFVEATDKFNPNTNPLYKPNATLQHKPLPSIGGIQAPEELAFPKSGSGSRWLTTVDSTGLPVPEGTYVTAAPATNTTFLQRINPANQRHLRMGQAFTPEFLNVTQGFSGGKPPEWKWLFDYTKDFSKTSIPQHGRNIVHIGKTIMAQPETKAFIAGAGNVAMKTGGAAGFLLDAPEIMYKENKQRMLKNAEKGTFKEATPLEVTQMMGKAVMGSIANAVTLGTAYAGTGEGRPTRGPARMSDSGDEALRRTMERANSWMPKDDFSDVPTIDDDIKSFLR